MNGWTDAWINLEAKTQGFHLNPSEPLPSPMRVNNTSLHRATVISNNCL